MRGRPGSLARLSAALVCLPLLGASPWPSALLWVPDPPEADAAAQIAIGRALGDWIEATNRGDEKRAAEVWAPGVRGWFPKLPEVQLAEAYRVAGVARREDAKPWSTWTLSIDEILVSGDLAVVRDLRGETLHFPGSHKLVQRDIRSFEVWRLQPDGKWRITRWISAWGQS
jgi:ketosteroid isomerase-like protein